MNTTYPEIKNMSPQLLVAGLQRSIDFYARILGFETDFIYDDFYAGISRQGCTIHLKCGSSVAAERANKRTNEHLDLVFSVEDIDGLFESLKSEWLIIVQPLRDMPYGREFYIADPDGYILGFLETK